MAQSFCAVEQYANSEPRGTAIFIKFFFFIRFPRLNTYCRLR